MIRRFELRDSTQANAQFTWSDFCERKVSDRIDRYLSSLAWEAMIRERRHEVGVRACLDHCPLILGANPV